MEALTLLAIVLSPLVAVLVTVWLQNRKERRTAKLWIFNTLIGSRHAPLSDQNIRALNMIDVVFHDEPKVRGLWRDYFEMLSNAGLNNPMGTTRRQQKNLEMIAAMADALGYGAQITHLDVDRVYYPQALVDQANVNLEIQKLMVRFFEGAAEALARQHAPPGGQPPVPPPTGDVPLPEAERPV